MYIHTVSFIIVFPKEISDSISNVITSRSKQESHASTGKEYPTRTAHLYNGNSRKKQVSLQNYVAIAIQSHMYIYKLLQTVFFLIYMCLFVCVCVCV